VLMCLMALAVHCALQTQQCPPPLLVVPPSGLAPGPQLQQLGQRQHPHHHHHHHQQHQLPCLGLDLLVIVAQLLAGAPLMCPRAGVRCPGSAR
jgi:hypothetical protein